jgi:hypothetical protein
MGSIRGDFGKPTKSGFLSFQDIIMSVTGILIVISLLLAIEIDRQPIEARATGVSGDADTSIASQTELSEVLDKLVRAETELEQLRASEQSRESESELKASIARLEEEVARLMSKSSVQRDSTEGTDQELLTKGVAIVRMTSEIEDLRKRLEAVSGVVSEQAPQLRGLETVVKEAEASVAAARLKGLKVRLVPEQSDTSKEPIIVDLSRTRAVVMRFDNPNPISAVTLPEFYRIIEQFEPTKQYFVLFVRPSGAGRFKQIRQAIVNSKFEVGYDAVEEDTEILLDKKN